MIGDDDGAVVICKYLEFIGGGWGVAQIAVLAVEWREYHRP